MLLKITDDDKRGGGSTSEQPGNKEGPGEGRMDTQPHPGSNRHGHHSGNGENYQYTRNGKESL